MDQPQKINKPWAESGEKNTIPETRSSTLDVNRATLDEGFPAVTMEPRASGGLPPFGQDMNGILNLLTQYARWHAAGGRWKFDAAFATAIGGYSKDMVLMANDGSREYISLINNNMTDFNTNPSSIGTAWAPLTQPFSPSALISGNAGNIARLGTDNGIFVPSVAVLPAGCIMLWPTNNPPARWIPCDGWLLNASNEPQLFAAIGTQYNTGGEGAGQFRAPNFNNRFPRHYQGQAVGAKQGHAQRNITGSFGGLDRHSGWGSGAFYEFANGEDLDGRGGSGKGMHFDSGRVVPVADEVRPEAIAMMYIIYLGA